MNYIQFYKHTNIVFILVRWIVESICPKGVLITSDVLEIEPDLAALEIDDIRFVANDPIGARLTSPTKISPSKNLTLHFPIKIDFGQILLGELKRSLQ